MGLWWIFWFRWYQLWFGTIFNNTVFYSLWRLAICFFKITINLNTKIDSQLWLPELPDCKIYGSCLYVYKSSLLQIDSWYLIFNYLYLFIWGRGRLIYIKYGLVILAVRKFWHKELPVKLKSIFLAWKWKECGWSPKWIVCGIFKG